MNTLEYRVTRNGIEHVQFRTSEIIVKIDFMNRDIKYWKQIFQQIRLTITPNSIAEQLIKQVVVQRWSYRVPIKKKWNDYFNKNICDWALNELQKFEKEINDLCIDNRRVARVGHRPSMRKFRKQRKAGCCGCFERIAHGPDGEYMIGFNYGH